MIGRVLELAWDIGLKIRSIWKPACTPYEDDLILHLEGNGTEVLFSRLRAMGLRVEERDNDAALADCFKE